MSIPTISRPITLGRIEALESASIRCVPASIGVGVWLRNALANFSFRCMRGLWFRPPGPLEGLRRLVV